MFVTIPIPISNLQYFWEKKLFVDVARQVIVENIKFETHGYGLQS